MKKSKYILVLVLVFTCIKYSEEEIFYIPKNYTGTIIVYFNQNDGELKEYENNKRIYRIPNDGILRTQFPAPKKNSYLNQEYYFLDKHGTVLSKIETFSSVSSKRFSRDDTLRFNMFSIGIQKSKQALESDKAALYFSIGELKNRDSLIIESHKQAESFIREN